MIEVTPLYPCVHSDAYAAINNLLGEEVAHQLLYDPREVYSDVRSDNGTSAETIEGWLRARVPDHTNPSPEKEAEEPAAP